MTEPLVAAIRNLADDIEFSGVVRIEDDGRIIGEFARGFAHRALAIPNQVDTRFAVASATKGLTALAVMSLVQSGVLDLDASVRGIVGDRLPLVDSGVTIRHLLAHRSGIGDYLDEEALGDIDDHVMGVSVHTLERPSDYVPLLSSHAQVSPPGERFSYNNSGFVILSLIIELVTGSFADTIDQRVLAPAGIVGGGFVRSDDLPVNTALGYLENGRTNIFHLPVIASGDGGIYLTLDDMSAFWSALLAGAIVSKSTVEAMTTAVSEAQNGHQYGLGFWLRDGGERVMLVGMDPGVSFRSSFNRRTNESFTVMSNTSSGAWPVAKRIESHVPIVGDPA